MVSAGQAAQERGGRGDAQYGGAHQDGVVQGQVGVGAEEEAAQGVDLVAQGLIMLTVWSQPGMIATG